MIEARNLRKYFPVRKGFLLRIAGYTRAVDDVSFRIKKGKTLGLVGESGCGKTTVGRLLLRLIEATSGEAYFEGRSIFGLGKEELRALRREMQIVFQDPFSSMNPRLRVYDIVGEPLENYGLVSGDEKEEAVNELLVRVGLEAEHGGRYPHEFSGGQRQRIAIARALILKPKFIVLDEPTSALDVSVQGRILKLIKELQDSLGLTYLLISHDLMVVKYVADEIAVMYMGRLVELSEKNELFKNPLHPYTQALLSAIPSPEPGVKKRRKIIEKTFTTRNGCSFYSKCEHAKGGCKTAPELVDAGGGHLVACHFISRS